MTATFYPPARGFLTWLRGALYRYNCGRRFGHFPVDDWDGCRICARCSTPLP